MIVLKSAQQNLLGALAAVAGIVERRHMAAGGMPYFNPILAANTVPAQQVVLVNWAQPRCNAPTETRVCRSRFPLTRMQAGFFCPTKVNARNAP